MKVKTRVSKVVKQLQRSGEGLLALLTAHLAAKAGRDASATSASAGGVQMGPAQWGDVEMADVLRVVTEAVLETRASEATGAEHYQRTETRTGYRNGTYLRQRLATPLGIVTNVQVPKLRKGTLGLDWLSQSLSEDPSLRGRAAALFARGMSVRGISAVSEGLFGGELSPSTASRFNAELDRAYKRWLETPIAFVPRFVFFDAIRLRVRRGREKCTEGVLAAMGIDEHGERQMLGFVWGAWESLDSWTCLLTHLKDRKLDMSKIELATVDGNAGLMAALRQSWPQVPVQRCWQHKTRNILGKCKNTYTAEMVKDLRAVKSAATHDQAVKARDAFEAKWKTKEPECVALLTKDWAHMVRYLNVPSKYWKLVMTTNILERAFVEFRRKFKNIPMMPTVTSAERLAFAQVDILNARWRGKQVKEWPNSLAA